MYCSRAIFFIYVRYIIVGFTVAIAYTNRPGEILGAHGVAAKGLQRYNLNIIPDYDGPFIRSRQALASIFGWALSSDKLAKRALTGDDITNRISWLRHTAENLRHAAYEAQRDGTEDWYNDRDDASHRLLSMYKKVLREDRSIFIPRNYRIQAATRKQVKELQEAGRRQEADELGAAQEEYMKAFDESHQQARATATHIEERIKGTRGSSAKASKQGKSLPDQTQRPSGSGMGSGRRGASGGGKRRHT